MTSTSVGRRLVILVLVLSSIVFGVVVAIALFTSTTALRAATEQTFTDQHAILVNVLEDKTDALEAPVDALAATIANQPSLTLEAARARVLERIGGSSAGLDIVSVNVFAEGQPDVYTFDYENPTIPPVSKTNDADIVRNGWVMDVTAENIGSWYGPHQSLFSSHEGLVVSYAVPLPDGAGAVWVDVPIGVIEAQLRTIIEANPTRTQVGYAFLMSGNREIIAAVNPPPELPLAGDRVPDIIGFPELNVPTFMTDPLTESNRVYFIVDIVPGTGWRLANAAQNDLLARALPASSVGQLLLGALLGVALMVVAVGRFIQRAVSVPLLRLTKAAQEIGAGDMRYEINYRERPGEIGELARALEDMKTNLAATYAELESWSTSLEQRVRSRTRELDLARREAQASANELRAVYDESLLVVSAYQLDTILQTLAQRIHNLMEAKHTAVWLVTDDGEHLQLVSTTANDQTRIGKLIDPDAGLVGRAATEQQLLVVDDYPNWSHKLPDEVTENTHQAMAVPLLFSGEVIGAVIVGRTYDAPFFAIDDQRLLRLLANLVSPAVRNAQLYVQRDNAVKEAQRANQVKTRFLASVTHELRTPLNLVINNMDFMRIGVFGEVNTEQVERLDQTIRSAEHLLHLINDLLDVSKIEAGELELHIREQDLYTILDDVVANTEVLLEQYEKADTVQFITEIADDIPEMPIDARRVRQVFVNLLSNAVKFTDAGHVKLEVINRRHYLRVNIKDTGMGITEEEIGKLFEAFERTTSAKEKGIEGTGLGLPICKFMVEAHGGEISVASVPNEGTTFTFTLPIRRQKRTGENTQQMSSMLEHARSDNSNPSS